MGKTQPNQLRMNRKNPDIQSPGTLCSGGLFIKDLFAIRKNKSIMDTLYKKWKDML